MAAYFENCSNENHYFEWEVDVRFLFFLEFFTWKIASTRLCVCLCIFRRSKAMCTITKLVLAKILATFKRIEQQRYKDTEKQNPLKPHARSHKL